MSLVFRASTFLRAAPATSIRFRERITSYGATKKPASLPEPLRYLQPFANALAKLTPEELNEDVDASRQDAALRKRVRGLGEEAAEAELAADREVLERWLEDKPDHPAHWIRGFLLSVPGGFVSATIDALGEDFDETPFDANLHTLRLSGSASTSA